MVNKSRTRAPGGFKILSEFAMAVARGVDTLEKEAASLEAEVDKTRALAAMLFNTALAGEIAVGAKPPVGPMAVEFAFALMVVYLSQPGKEDESIDKSVAQIKENVAAMLKVVGQRKGVMLAAMNAGRMPFKEYAAAMSEMLGANDPPETAAPTGTTH